MSTRPVISSTAITAIELGAMQPDWRLRDLVAFDEAHRDQ
jgi:hypothetical protein